MVKGSLLPIFSTHPNLAVGLFSVISASPWPVPTNLGVPRAVLRHEARRSRKLHLDQEYWTDGIPVHTLREASDAYLAGVPEVRTLPGDFRGTGVIIIAPLRGSHGGIH